MPRESDLGFRADTAAGWAAAEVGGVATSAGENVWIDNDLVKCDGVTKVAALPRAGTGTYAPLLPTGAALTAAIAQAERNAATGVTPPRMATPPTVYGPAKGSGITGTPTVSAGGTGYVVGDQITLAGGTFSVAAILQVATVTTGAVTSVTVVRNGMYTVTPANAVAQASTTGAGTGATFTVSWSPNGQSISLNRQTIGPTDVRFRFTGVGAAANLSGSGFYGSGVFNGVHTSWEWSTNSQRVDVPLIGLGTKGILYVDGKAVSGTAIVTDASGTQYLYALDFGSSAWRTFRWVGFSNAFGGIRIDGTATMTAPLASDRPLWWNLGDSYTLSVGAENACSQHIMVMGDALGIDVLPDGISSSGWNSGGADVPATRVTSRLNSLTRQVDYVGFDLGLNDAGGNMTTAAAAFDAAYAAVKASPNVKATTKYFCFGPATPLGRTTNLDLVRDMLIARCAAAGDVRFVDVGDWVSATSKTQYTDGDNTHPSNSGHKYLGARRALMVQPYL